MANVYLKNGFELVDSPYGKGVTIHGLEALHRAIGLALVASPAALVGSEFRFLRRELEFPQAGLARLLGCDEQSIARWEKGQCKRVDPSADRLLRMLYREAMMSSDTAKPLADFLSGIDSKQVAPRQIVATASKANWRASSKAA